MIVSDQWPPSSSRGSETEPHSFVLMQMYMAPSTAARRLRAQPRTNTAHSSGARASLAMRRFLPFPAPPWSRDDRAVASLTMHDLVFLIDLDNTLVDHDEL